MMLGETKITIESKPPAAVKGVVPTMGFIKKFFMLIGVSVLSFILLMLAMFGTLIFLMVEVAAR